MKYHALMALCLCVLCGCGRSTPTNYYLLENSPGVFAVENLPSRTLRVALVETPAYLNRNNIVSRVHGETKLILAEFHLWAEPVSNGVRRVVAERLAGPMLETGINVLPPASESGGDYVLLIDLARLDGNFNQPAVLQSYWTLLNKDEKPLQRGIFSAEEVVNGANYNALVSAESSLVRKFGDYLAKQLPSIISADK